jgi:hypothetical protein
MVRTGIPILLLGVACAAACLADTLTLRNGQVVQGTYMGGTARTVKLQVDDSVRTYDVTDIATLQFTPPAPTASETVPPVGQRGGAHTPPVFVNGKASTGTSAPEEISKGIDLALAEALTQAR